MARQVQPVLQARMAQQVMAAQLVPLDQPAQSARMVQLAPQVPLVPRELLVLGVQ